MQDITNIVQLLMLLPPICITCTLFNFYLVLRMARTFFENRDLSLIFGP